MKTPQFNTKAEAISYNKIHKIEEIANTAKLNKNAVSFVFNSNKGFYAKFNSVAAKIRFRKYVI